MKTNLEERAGGFGDLSEHLRNSILERLGFLNPPSADLDGLVALYAAWCTRVPFDNIRKMIALRRGGSDTLPGMDAGEFFDSWLKHGNGGTCWPSSNALFALVRSLGFQVCRIAGAMRDLGVINHASLRVTLGDCDWLADSSLLTDKPLALYQQVFVTADPVFPVEVEPVDGTHVIWFSNPPNPNYLPCRLMTVSVDHPYYLAAYERTRERSPFNQSLYVRINRPREMLVLSGHTHLREGLVFPARQHLEELRVRVPQLPLDEFLDGGSFPAIFAGDAGLAGQLRDLRNRECVPKLIAVDRRAVAAAADRNFHAVAIIDLPVQPVCIAMRLLPGLGVRHEVRQQPDSEGFVAVYTIARPDRIRGPETVVSRVAAFAEPEDRVVVGILRIRQPAALVEMMPCRAGNLDWRWNAMHGAVRDVTGAHFVHFFLSSKLPRGAR